MTVPALHHPGAPPPRHEDPTAVVFNALHRFIKKRLPYATQPTSVMIVVAVNGNTCLCRRPADANHNGYNYRWLVPYGTTAVTAPPAVGDKVLIHNDPNGPYIAGRLS